jgi:hypothetical protein
MRHALLTSVAVLGLAVAVPAFAQSASPAPNADIRPGHVPGVGVSEPSSSQASNILPSDTQSPIAPTLPTPPDSPSASPSAYLRTAQQALADHRTGEAQEALERAETRMLDRSTRPSDANSPDDAPRVARITAARDALAHGDYQRANDLITQALASGQAAGMTAPPSAPVMATVQVAPSPVLVPNDGPNGAENGGDNGPDVTHKVPRPVLQHDVGTGQTN